MKRLVLFTVLGCGILALSAPVAGAASPPNPCSTVTPSSPCTAPPGEAPTITITGCASATFSYDDFPAGDTVNTTETVVDGNGTTVGTQQYSFTVPTPNPDPPPPQTGGPPEGLDTINITGGLTNGETLTASTAVSIPAWPKSFVVTSAPYTVTACPPASPAISTTASPTGVDTGAPFSDSAALSGGNSPTGTITFNLYAASDTTCSAPLSTSPPVTVTGDGTYTSPTVTESSAGSYVWVASYSGDPNNNPVADPCGQAAETVTVVAPPPILALTAITTKASKDVVAGGKISDTASLTQQGTAPPPTGTIKFTLYAASDRTCSTPLGSAGPVTVTGAGSYTSRAITETKVGTYQWVASYSGDANNASSTEICGSSTAERVTVTPPPCPKTMTTAALAGVSGVNAKTTSFSPHVSARGIKSVTFLLDGHKLATVTKPHDGAFSITVHLKRYHTAKFQEAIGGALYRTYRYTDYTMTINGKQFTSRFPVRHVFTAKITADPKCSTYAPLIVTHPTPPMNTG